MKTYRITLNSNDRQSGTVDNAFFPVNFPISDVGDDAGKPWMLWLESFLVDDTEDVIDNKTYAVRLRQAANGTVFSTDQLPNDILAVFQGIGHERQFAHEGVACYDKTLFNSKLWNVYLTSPRYGALPYLSRAYPPAAMTAGTQAIVSGYGKGTYVASASSFVASRDPYNAFQPNSLLTYWSSDAKYVAVAGNSSGAATTYLPFDNVNVSGEWIQLQMPAPVSVSTYTMMVQFPQYAPKTWVLLGSNEGTDWVVVDDDSNTTWTASASYTFSLAKPSLPYTYWRLVVKTTNGATTAEIGTLLLNTEVTWTATLVAWKDDNVKK